MATTPAPKADQLIERLNSLLEAKPVNTLALQSVKSEAKTLVHSDAPQGHCILGMVASIEKNHQDLKYHFDIAIRLIPNDVLIRKHYVTSLINSGLHDDAFDAAKQVLSLSPADSDMLDKILHEALLIGRPREGKEYLERWNAIRPDQDQITAAIIQRMSDFMAEHQISDDSISEIYKIAHEVSHGHHQPRIEAIEQTIAGDDEYEWIQAFFAIRGSVNEVVALNVKLAETLAKLDPPPVHSDLVSVMFVPAVEDADHA